MGPSVAYYQLPCDNKGMLDMPNGLNRLRVTTADPRKYTIPHRRG